jgi:hypothetical protein
MFRNLQPVAGLAGSVSLALAFVAALANQGNLGWLLVALAAFLFALSIFTGSSASLHDS